MQQLSIGIGDLHGHLPALESLLGALNSEYRIFEAGNNLREGVELTFIGDYIDRGEFSLQVVEAVIELDHANENVHALMGNHELMALASIDFVTEISQALEDENLHDPNEKHKLEQHLLQVYENENHHGRNGGYLFLKNFSDGKGNAFSKYLDRMGEGGDIGDWMRNLEPFHISKQLGKKILYVHGGIPSHLSDPGSLKKFGEVFEIHMQMNSMPSEEKYRKNNLVDNNSPFWDRSIPFGTRDPVEVADSVGMDYLVIGHTPQRFEGTIANYENRIFNIDIGMSSAYGENDPGAIIFKEDGIHEFYVSKSTGRVGERKLVDYE